MIACYTCGAPLPGGRTRCLYCGTRNSVDLQLFQNYSMASERSSRWCPKCYKKELVTINLGVHQSFTIERCETCDGLFFDNRELEHLLEQLTKPDTDINVDLLYQLAGEAPKSDYTPSYHPCPVCKSLMNRINYGGHSGVIIDFCLVDGIWLDAGELLRLCEWKKAGGELLSNYLASGFTLLDVLSNQKGR